MRFSSGILNELIAPEICSFTEAVIPDLELSTRAKVWVVGHYMNSLLRGGFKPGTKQLVLSYQRRAYHAADAYHEARLATFRYLEESDENPNVWRYYKAIGFWETFTLQTQMAIDIIRWLQKGEEVFTKNDGSIEQRLYTIANQVKHLDSHVRSANFRTTDTVPLWLSNNGIHSFGVRVSYTEASELLSELADIAEQFQDPLTFAQSRESQTA